MRRPTLKALPAVSGTLLTVLGIVVFANSWGVFNTDIKPEVYLAPQRMLGHYLSSWTDSPYLGSPNFNVGLLPVLAVTAVLRALGLSPELAFKVYHLALWVVAALGANRLLRTVVPTASRWAGLVAGVAYIANPYTVSAGSTLAIALPLALLPWMLLCLVRALREPKGWAWPALFGLSFFAMSGMNVAVVPILQLLLVIPLTITVRHQEGLSWRQVAVVLARCALFVVLLSLYWLVPAAFAMQTGGQIVEGSETLEGIAKVSSFTEVLRGLGLWSIYGRTDLGPWVPEQSAYVAQPFFILLTALWPAAGLASLRWVPRHVERTIALTIGLVAVVMVGLFPAGGSSPFGWLLVQAFEHVPPLLAFRTTNKIGSGLALFLALAIGIGAVQGLPRILRRPGIGPFSVSVLLVAVFAWTGSALTGNLYTSPLEVPGYWRQAADRVDEGAPDGRVLVLPGQVRSTYRWSEERPDDLPNSLFDRPAVIPETTPNTSAWGANLLASLDDELQSGVSSPEAISTYARYLGADQVLLRHDIAWEASGGGRPGLTARTLSADSGLTGIANFGEPGQNTAAPGIAPESEEEALLPPLQLYGVGDAAPVVRAAPVRGQVVVAGDGWSIGRMAGEGVLRRTPGLSYALDTSVDDLRRVLDAGGGRLVLTDTNERRAAITTRLTAGQGAVLPADQTPEITRTLGDDPDDQSVLVEEGIRVRATQQGGSFFDLPYAVPQNAFDGDRKTSWLFGDFRRAVGQSVTATLPATRELGTIRITPTALGSVRIDEVEVRAGTTVKRVNLREKGATTVDLGGVSTDEVRITVRSLAGDGYSLVGLTEVDLGTDDLAQRTTRTPTTFDDRYAQLTAAERETFAQTPFDVLLRRVASTASPSDDTERTLRRDFSLPDDRVFQGSAGVRVDGDVETVYDAVLGTAGDYTATSSAFDFDNPRRRASMAADGDRSTAWAPTAEMKNAWWQIQGPRRTIDRVVIDQRAAEEGYRRTQYASRVAVLVDGEEVAREDVQRGRSTVRLPEGTTGRTVRVVIKATDGLLGGRPARFTTIDTGAGARVEADSGTVTCQTVATIDGRPLRMRPQQLRAPLSGVGVQGTTWRACGEVELPAGDHELRPADGYQLDSLSLRDTQGLKVARTAPAAVTTVHRDLDRGTTVEVGRSSGPVMLSIGQGYDPRWRATLEDGTDLGEPQVVGGYATGWLIPDGKAHTVHVDFAPQRYANVALLVSLLTLLLSLVVVFRRFVRTGAHDTVPAADGPDPETVVPAPDVRSRFGRAGVVLRSALPTVGRRAGSTGGTAVEPGGTAPDEPAAPSPLRWAWVRTPLGASVIFVVVAGLLTGIGGALGGLTAVLVARHRRATSGTLILGGVGIFLAAICLYLVLGRDVWPQVSADVVARSLVPHHLAAAGLVWSVAGALWRSVERKDPDDPTDD